jgi:hypothetical protein
MQQQYDEASSMVGLNFLWVQVVLVKARLQIGQWVRQALRQSLRQFV